MSQFDRDKWDNRYSQPGSGEIQACSELFDVAWEYLPPTGRALDVAGGTGRNSWPLVERGWQVTLADISQVALEVAEQTAVERGVRLQTNRIDFELDPFPSGPWDAIVQVCFLERKLFSVFPSVLAPGGLLLIAQPTARNLERHEKPPRPFLLAEGELLGRWPELKILHYGEDWRASGRHEVHLIAQR